MKRRPRTPVLPSTAAWAGALVALLTGCASPVEEPVPQTAWGNTTAIEELVIGVETGADEYMIGRVNDVAVGNGGEIYVADGQLEIVRMYDADGNYLRDIGRRGQGPGEYAYAPSLGTLPDGTLVISDTSSGRISFFSPAGDYLDSFTAARVGSFTVDRDGNIHAQRFEGEPVLAEFTRGGEQLGRLPVPARDIAGAETFVLGWGEGNIYPFPVETQWDFSPLGYLVTGRNDVYDIELRRPDGTVHLRRDIPRPEVNGEEQNQWEAHRQRLIERVTARGDEADFEPIPDVKPYFRQIHVAADGRIWVFRYVEAVERDDIEPVPDMPDRPLLTWREPWTYDVFEPDGTFLGAVVVPETFRPYVIRGERLWGAVERDGLEQVVRLAVEPEAR